MIVGARAVEEPTTSCSSLSEVGVAGDGPRGSGVVVVGTFAVCGDLDDGVVEVVEGAVGVVWVPVGDGGGDPRLLVGDGVVGEMVGASSRLVGELVGSLAPFEEGDAGGVIADLAVEVFDPFGEAVAVLVEQFALAGRRLGGVRRRGRRGVRRAVCVRLEAGGDGFGVGVGESLVDGGERWRFWGVDAVGGELVEPVLHGRRDGCGPVGEGVVGVADAGEFGVFDDVGPVLEDPLASLVLGVGGVAEGLVDVGGVEFAVVDGGDDAGLVGWGGGEEWVEFGERFADGGDVERFGVGCGQVGVVVWSQSRVARLRSRCSAQRARCCGLSGGGP